MAGKGGGAWKVAYADFVTAMMAFFLVMWIVGQSKPVKQAVAQYFEDPLGVDQGSRSTSLQGPEDSTTIGAFESGLGPARGLAMAQNKAVGRRNMVGVAARKPPHVVIFRHFNRTYSVGTVLQFGQDTAALDSAAKERLDNLLPLVMGKPNKIEVRVYAPRQALPKGGTFGESWQLARDRALATMKYLTEHGISPDRLRLSQDGALEPDTLYTGEKKQVPNARVEIFALDEYVDKERNPSPLPVADGGDPPENSAAAAEDPKSH
ncbi:MAG TPA: flagellar motor protein MotB [Planctomycetaceae bacterium]|jgi:chemotaxis protein MotB|nr:flagellar motor protein MotB [Planctomycetaceae bacterium]